MKAGEEAFYRITAEEAAADFDPLELVYPVKFRFLKNMTSTSRRS